jgi:hypothetical protein
MSEITIAKALQPSKSTFVSQSGIQPWLKQRMFLKANRQVVSCHDFSNEETNIKNI